MCHKSCLFCCPRPAMALISRLGVSHIHSCLCHSLDKAVDSSACFSPGPKAPAMDLPKLLQASLNRSNNPGLPGLTREVGWRSRGTSVLLVYSSCFPQVLCSQSIGSPVNSSHTISRPFLDQIYINIMDMSNPLLKTVDASGYPKTHMPRDFFARKGK